MEPRSQPPPGVPHRIPVWVGKEGLPGGTVAPLGEQGDRERCDTVRGGPRPNLRSWEALAGCRTQCGRHCGRGDSDGSSASLLTHRQHHASPLLIFCLPHFSP